MQTVYSLHKSVAVQVKLCDPLTLPEHFCGKVGPSIFTCTLTLQTWSEVWWLSGGWDIRSSKLFSSDWILMSVVVHRTSSKRRLLAAQSHESLLTSAKTPSLSASNEVFTDVQQYIDLTSSAGRRSSSLAWSLIPNCLFCRTFAISRINPPKL